MARTKGAKDKRPRKLARRGANGRFAKASPPAATPSPTSQTVPPAVGSLPIEGPAVVLDSGSEFDRVAEAVLGNDSLSRGETCPAPGPAGVTVTDRSTSPPAATAEELMGIDAWQAILEAPFRSAALWLGIPALDQLGKLRSAMLAKPSYPIYRHYVTQWLTDNPDDELFIAKVMTAAAAATVLQEAWIILKVHKMQRGTAAVSGTEPKDVKGIRVDQLHTDN